MTRNRNDDQAMASALRRTLRESRDASGRDCPDATILAAYFDRELPAAELARWEAHFSTCALCQDQLAVLARTEPVTGPLRAPGYFWGWRWLAPLATAAAAVALWVAVQPPTTTMVAPTDAGVATHPQSARSQPPAPESGPAEKAAEADRVAAARTPAAVRDRPASVGPAKPKASTEAPLKRALAAERQKDRLEANRLGALATPAEKTRTDEITVAEGRIDPSVRRESALARPGEQAEKKSLEMEKSTDRAAVVVQADERAKSRELAGKRDAPDQPAAASAPLEAESNVAALRAQKAEAARFSALRAAPPTAAAPGGEVIWRFGPRGLIEKSSDGGKMWTRQPSPTNTRLAAGSAPSKEVCWAVGAEGVVLRTTDGERWEKVASPTEAGLHSVAARNAMEARVTAVDGKTYVTADGGRTWREKQP
jgi:hypothetical protein